MFVVLLLLLMVFSLVNCCTVSFKIYSICKRLFSKTGLVCFGLPVVLVGFKPRATRSSSVVTLSRPPTSSSLKITNRSFRYASPHLWNQLPVSFRQPCTKHPADDVTLSNSPSIFSPLSPSITHSLFHSRLKTHLFHKSFPP